MKLFSWYLLVAIDLTLFILSLVYKNIYLAISALALGVFLDRFTKKIPYPKAFDKFRSVSFKNKKK